jgi:hypothetical protein
MPFEPYLQRATSFEQYITLLESLMEQGKTTGADQSELMVAYAKLNLQRMRRIDKTTKLLPELQETLAAIKQPQTWIVLTEGWCGDAAQILPLFHVIAAQYPVIQLRILLRDENTTLMDQYLTNGGRSIPKLIIIDTASLTELGNWGPRPAAAHQLLIDLKSAGADMEEMKEKLHGWYAKDKTVSVQQELITLLSGALPL